MAQQPAQDWLQPFRVTNTIRIVTQDANGAARNTPVWVVALEGAAWVRTNNSRWLANIRRGSPVEIRARQTTQPVRAAEVTDAEQCARVEAAFKQKYGLVQKILSFVRLATPQVLRLERAT